MINPIYIIAIALGVGFLLSLFDKMGRKLSLSIVYLSLLAFVGISVQWFFFAKANANPIVYTAGFKPPFSINLKFGQVESFLTLFVNVMGFLSAIFLGKKFLESKVNSLPLYLVLIAGINGMIMTRDVFNMFVFIEIVSIATYSILVLERNIKTLSAGFKYTIAGGLASTFYLLGTIFIYKYTGTLNIDDIIAHKSLLANSMGSMSIFLLLISLVIELKQFPANGWALDVYESAPSGIASVVAVGNSAAAFYAFYKLFPIIPANTYILYAVIGLTTFVASNIMALKQTNAKRLLGYSSIGQMSLLLAVFVFLKMYGINDNADLYLILGGFFVSHFIAKAGLFWISGIVGEKLEDFKKIKNNPLLLFSFGIFIFMLLGVPPFPSFWAKWHLVMLLSSKGVFVPVSLVLIGSLLEMIYLARWLGIIVHTKSEEDALGKLREILPIAFFMVAGIFISMLVSNFDIVSMSPILAAAILFTLSWLPNKIKAIISMAIVGYYGYVIIPQLTGMRLLFSYIFIIGSGIQIFASMSYQKKKVGYYAFLTMMILAMGNLLRTDKFLNFFINWEFMALSAYFIILMGRKSEKASLIYVVFSTLGSYLMLAGFGLAYKLSGSMSFSGLFNAQNMWVYILVSMGFLIKSGAVGFHIWLPGAYSESDDDFSPIISSVMSKAGVFGLMLVLVYIHNLAIFKINLDAILGWVGIITVFFGTLMSLFQEDMKKLLAYSSMGQLGYIILGLAMYSHMGWVAAIYLAFNHLFFKALLFLAIAGVIYRTNTRNMYELGGLIKNMPISFISVLIGIIALSGVPPLSGFPSKWTLYSALIERGWYYHAGLAFFTSSMAFLYCFRLIHAIFLGQRKLHHKNIKEAPVWFLIPQIVMIIALMFISVKPQILIKKISDAVSVYLPTTMNFAQNTISSRLGYFNGFAVMLITMITFIIFLVYMLTKTKNMAKVKQFNIVYAGERPDKPETTHFAYDFYAPYKKALGHWAKPKVTEFWKGVSEWLHTIGHTIRTLYTGNAQTYVLHILLLIIISYIIIGGK